MIQVDEQEIDKISAVFYAMLNGKRPVLIELSSECPDNEIRQAVGYINRFVVEYNASTDFAYQLGRGEINIDPLSKGGLIIGQSLKELHASLKNLTWTTKRIASGDFSQRVSFMGEFSEAFNSMAQQLSTNSQEQKELTENLRNQIKEMERTRRAMLNLLEDLEEAKRNSSIAPE